MVDAWLPDRRSLVLVFGSAAFLTYTWTLLVSFWKIPSWLFFLAAGQIFSIYAYSFLINLVEATALTAIAVFLWWVPPGRWWRVDFVPVSVSMIAGIVAALNLWIRQYAASSDQRLFLDGQLSWAIGIPALLLAIAYLFHKIGFLKRAASSFADRAVIFLYIYLPMTAVALITVLIRAIF